MPNLCVIIPHYNDVLRLEKCLTALNPQLSEQAEAIVVDNGSTQSLEPQRAKFENIRFVTEEKKGAAPARNRGVAETTAPFIAFLDADCVPELDWVAYGLSVMGKNDMTGGDVGIFHETDGPLTGAQAFEAVFAFDIKSYIEEKNFTVTANLITSRRVFDAVGPFRPGVSEDLDWCIRARDADFILVFDPSLRVSHPSRNDWPALRKKWIRMTEEGFGLVPDTPAGRVKWAIRGLAMVPSAVAHTPKLLASKDLSSWPDRLAGLATLYRLRLLRSWWMLRQAAGMKIA